MITKLKVIFRRKISKRNLNIFQSIDIFYVNLMRFCLICIVYIFVKLAIIDRIFQPSYVFERENKFRINKIDKMCETLKLNGENFHQLKSDLLVNIIVDKYGEQEKNFLYCNIPNVASKTWKTILSVRANSSIDNWKRHVGQLNDEEKPDVISNASLKFLIVRHPQERLLATFQDLFESNSSEANGNQKAVGIPIIQNIRNNPSDESLSRAHDVQFSEFLEFIVSKNVTYRYWQFEEYWAPISDLCYPCAVNYNYIGKFETIFEDSNSFSTMLNDRKIRFSKTNPNRHQKQLVLKYYCGIPNELIEKVNEMYRNDYKLFDYVGYDLSKLCQK